MRVASINFWGLPWPLSVKKRDRVGKLISFIRTNRLDIICLQEIWKTRDLNLLKSRLKEYYFYDESKRKNNPSGLVIISKYPLVEGIYIPFWNMHYEFVFKKGMLITKTIINNKKLIIINTHLYTTLFPLKSKIWLRQLTELYSAIENNDTLIFGDFNFNYPDFPLPDLFLLSEDKISTRNTENPLNKKSFNKFSKVNMVCDLILSNFEVKVIQKSILRSNFFTDHYPVICEFKIRKKKAIN